MSSRHAYRGRTTSPGRLAVLVAVLCGVLGLASSLAMTSGAAQASGPARASGQGSGRAATAPRGAPPPPPVNACYRLDFGAATQPTSDASPVPCSKAHTTQTYYVGRLDTFVDGHLLAVDSDHAQRQLEQTCPRKLDAYVGGSPEARALSRVKAVWFSPTLAQSDQGASWFRCDAVAVSGPSTLAPLPPPSRLRGILDRPGALSQVGLCGTTAPGARGFQRVICSAKHAWRAISTIPLSGGTAYPGARAVSDAGESTCRSQVQQATSSPDKFSYGWEWPTKDQWDSGQHFGYCWAPD